MQHSHHSTAGDLKSSWGPKRHTENFYLPDGKILIVGFKDDLNGERCASSRSHCRDLGWGLKTLSINLYTLCLEGHRKQKVHLTPAIEASTLDDYLTVLSRDPNAILLVILLPSAKYLLLDNPQNPHRPTRSGPTPHKSMGMLQQFWSTGWRLWVTTLFCPLPTWLYPSLEP